MARRTQIKVEGLQSPIEVNSDSHPELYGILQMLKARDENIPRILRGLLLRDYSVEYLVNSGASREKVLSAIVSLRKAIAVLSLEAELFERELGVFYQASSPAPVDPQPDEPDDEVESFPDPF